ncbi:MAG: aspartate carbamoyltransferase [Nanoarchaeota archaeon]
MNNPFISRTISKTSDLSIDEQLYLYKKTKELKEAYLKNPKDKKTLDKFRINDLDFGIYHFFLEPSTRTKESFWNASEFHRCKVNNLDIASSSLKKKESYYDTIKTLVNYDNNIFIIRSKTEGLCTYLEDKLKKFSKRNNILKPAFINGGDGEHEHPTQEELDEFTFMEHMNGKRDYIHVALIGDLLHGRTVHSKANGLKRFNEVKVDLIAPKIIQMPKTYVNIMKQNGFEVNVFENLKEYYNQKNIAPIHYFTRLQLERMGDTILQRKNEFEEAVTFKKEFLNLIPKNTKFYHPLPMNKENPSIPDFIEETKLNGWDVQSQNGYFWRIALLSSIAGKIGNDFIGESIKEKNYIEDFILPIKPKNYIKKEIKEGITPISNGIVIDHICRGENTKDIWKHLSLMHNILKIYDPGFMGVGESNQNSGIYKGLMAIPNYSKFNEKDIKRLSAVSPGCTLNIVKNNKVIEKYRLSMPPVIYGFEHTCCKNEKCITSDEFEKVQLEFIKSKNNTFACKYCDYEHSFKEIWKL